MRLLEAISTYAGKYFAVLVILTTVVAYLLPSPFLGIRQLYYHSPWDCQVF